MDRAKWKDQLLNVVDIVKDHLLEQAVKNASDNNELECPNPDCDSKFLQYCHGDINTAFFRHKSVGNCKYAKYEQAENEKIRVIRRRLYEHFSSQYSVEMLAEVINNHYTHLLITKNDSSKLAIELVYKPELQTIENLMLEYDKLNIPVNWIVVSRLVDTTNKEKFSELKRFILHKSKKKQVVAIERYRDEDISYVDIRVKQYKLDTNDYEYKGRKIVNGDVYKCKDFPINSLIIKDNEVCIKDFEIGFEQWLQQRQQEYDEKIKQYQYFESRVNNNTVNNNYRSDIDTSQLDYKDLIVLDLIGSIKKRLAQYPDLKLQIYKQWPDEKEWFVRFRYPTKNKF